LAEQSRSTTLAHRVKYDVDEAIVRLKDGVTSESIIWLCDEIDLAIEYYNYRQVDIHLDSPGGEIPALEYFMTRLKVWREVEGLVIRTLALTSAASAAAMILSLGSIGHRRAYPSAELLYHDGRIFSGQGRTWTRDALQRHHSALTESDTRLNRALASHVMKGKAGDDGTLALPALEPATADRGDLAFRNTVVKSEDELAAIYAELNARDTFISPQTALDMHLIDAIQR
jgi:ATP-dependent protease ClpP protease subunit